MSVSGWETRSTTSAMSMDDRRARQYQHPQPRRPPAENQWSATASQSSHAARSRHGDAPSRHLSFPAQHQNDAYGPPPGYAERPADAHHRRQQSDRLPRPSAASAYQNQVPYYEQQQPTFDQRQAPRVRQSPQQQYHKQYYSPVDHARKRPQELPTYTDPQQPPQNFYSTPQYDQPEYGYQQSNPDPRQRLAKKQSFYGKNQPVAPIIQEEDFHDSLPPPLPVRRGPSPIPIELPDHPVRETPATSGSSSADDEPINIDDVLLGKRWTVQIISHLCQFQRQELGEYAHELVKFLRGNAVMNYEQEFGYSVMIRYTSECVVFQIVEARDLHAELYIERMEQPQRQEQKLDTNQFGEGEADIRQRTGSFVVYLPKSAEDGNSFGRLGPGGGNNGQRRSKHGARNDENGIENGRGLGGTRGDPKYVFLQRGNEELMSWVGSWVQRRFQCVIGFLDVHVTEDNLRRSARNWVIEALEREAKIEKQKLRKAEKVRKVSAASGDEMSNSPNGHHPQPMAWPMRAPLLLKYRSKKETDVVKAYTLTLPWASVRRVHALMDGGVGSALGTVPEVIDRLEHLYFGNLQRDIAAMELTGIQMEEVEVDIEGRVKFFKPTLVHSVLQSFLDIFVVQPAPVPTEPVMTF